MLFADEDGMSIVDFVKSFTPQIKGKYHFHTSDQRKASAYVSHIALTQNVNEI